MEDLFTFLGFFTAFVIVLLSTPALIKVAYLKRLVDEPGDARKVHKRRIPTIGGILIFAGTLFSYYLWYPFDQSNIEYGNWLRAINDFKYISAAMLLLFFVGVKDDIIGTAPVKKLVGHLLVGFILVIMADIRITSLHGLFGITEELPYWASIGLSIFTYTVIVNAFNLIDGVDGLAAGIGTVVCIAFGVWFYLADSRPDALLSLSLAGALLGFLVFNFSPAKIFMGDSGSLTIGLIVSVLSIKLIEFDIDPLDKELVARLGHISRPVFAMAVLAYPLIDTLRIFIYRAVRGVSPFSADRNHIHHRLIDVGLGHRQTVLVLYAYNLIVIAVAVFFTLEPSISLLVVAATAIGLVQIPFLFMKKKPQPAAPTRKGRPLGTTPKSVSAVESDF